MANMELIEAKTLTTTTANITFSAIPATYTDLHLVLSVRSSKGGNEDGLWISQINGSGSNLSNKWLRGSGSSVISSDSATYGILVGQINGSTATASSFSNISIYITDYASANNKSILIDSVQERNATESYMGFTTGLWSNSNAVTSITFDTEVGDFVQYSTAYLYGIKNASVGAKATGGVLYKDGSYFYHSFTSTGTFTPTTSLTADILVIGGGGGSTSSYSGGGGAGGIAYKTGSSLTATAYTCTVGAGGAGTNAAQTNSGVDSSIAGSGFSTITANGGGGGGYSNNNLAAAGGSGGGGGGYGQITGGASNQGTSGGATGYGNAGGNGVANPNSISGGGGGAGTAGGNGSGTQAGANGRSGDGGNGLSTWSDWAVATGTGDRGYFAGGGGGGGRNDAEFTNSGQGGIGGGGDGSYSTSFPPQNGMANTGGGGGGHWNGTGGSGGSGIIIIRYAI
jgi:hypothetical protein